MITTKPKIKLKKQTTISDIDMMLDCGQSISDIDIHDQSISGIDIHDQSISDIDIHDQSISDIETHEQSISDIDQSTSNVPFSKIAIQLKIQPAQIKNEISKDNTSGQLIIQRIDLEPVKIVISPANVLTQVTKYPIIPCVSEHEPNFSTPKIKFQLKTNSQHQMISQPSKDQSFRPFWNHYSQTYSECLWSPTLNQCHDIAYKPDFHSWFNCLVQKCDQLPEAIPQEIFEIIPKFNYQNSSLFVRRIRLFPNTIDKIKFKKMFGAARFTYNNGIDLITKGKVEFPNDPPNGLKEQIINQQGLTLKCKLRQLLANNQVYQENPNVSWMLNDLPQDLRDSVICELYTNYINCLKQGTHFVMKKRTKKKSQSITIRRRCYDSKKGFCSFIRQMNKSEIFPDTNHDFELQCDRDGHYYLIVIYDLNTQRPNKLEKTHLTTKPELKLKLKLKHKHKHKHTSKTDLISRKPSHKRKKKLNQRKNHYRKKKTAQKKALEQIIIQPKIQPKVKPKIQLKIQPKIQFKVQPEVQPKIRLKIQPEVQPKVQPKVQLKIQPKIPLFSNDQWSENQTPILTMKIGSGDPGVRTFLTVYTPDGYIFHLGCNDIKRLYRLFHHMNKLQKKMSHSNGRKKRRMYKAWIRLSQRIHHLVDDLHKKIAKWLFDNFQTIIIPKLDVNQFSGKKTTRATRNKLRIFRHCSFVERLKNLQRWYPATNLVIPTEEYTSKTCSQCGSQHPTLGSNKIFHCPNPKCQQILDRDVNGSLNILIKVLTESTNKVDY